MYHLSNVWPSHSSWSSHALEWCRSWPGSIYKHPTSPKGWKCHLLTMAVLNDMNTSPYFWSFSLIRFSSPAAHCGGSWYAVAWSALGPVWIALISATGWPHTLNLWRLCSMGTETAIWYKQNGPPDIPMAGIIPFDSTVSVVPQHRTWVQGGNTLSRL